MEYARLGSSGLRVSRIGLGMMSYGDPADVPWYLDEAAAEPIVRHAVESGITFFDTADMYSDGVSEQITGRLLARLFPRRDDYVLATKVYYPTGAGPNDRGLSRKHVMAAVDASLRRLGTDYIDLYQVHRWDDGTPIEETITALQDLVRAGKVRYLGASLMRGWQFAVAQFTAARLSGSGAFVSMQTRYNLSYREEEREMLPLCANQGVGVLPYSPLARGLLARPLPVAHPPTAATTPPAPTPARAAPSATGATARAATEGGRRIAVADAAVVEALHLVAAARGLPPAQIALAWLLGRPSVTAPIIGATKPGHLDDALAAVHLRLTADEVHILEAPYLPREPFGYT
jgi:aryl-alcohol dehydrogenase-like predicted oxidoreductase